MTDWTEQSTPSTTWTEASPSTPSWSDTSAPSTTWRDEDSRGPLYNGTAVYDGTYSYGSQIRENSYSTISDTSTTWTEV